MKDSPLDDGKSFSLTKKVSATDKKPKPIGEATAPEPISWQEQAYDRLKVLYGVGKLLSTFESVETTFPQILDLCATSFPFLTGVLIERRGKKVMTAMWNAENATDEQVAIATRKGISAFVYLTGASKIDSETLYAQQISSQVLVDVKAFTQADTTGSGNCIALPLFVDKLPAFGVLQFEGASRLSEKDVEFVDALSDLVAIAIDRYYRIQSEREANQKEALDSSSKLTLSKASVTDLELERELRENFVSSLSHDLRTPLSAAKISAQLIQREVDIPEGVQNLAARIVANMNRVDQMITDLLDANRLRSGEKLPLKIEGFDLTALIAKTLDELATIHGDLFIFKSPETLIGYWDKKSIRRIIENLCNNAIKYGSSVGPVTLKLNPESGHVEISVQNEGGIISPEDQKSLFQQFKRSLSAQGSGKTGWGIGLALVRGVAEAHGGSVSIISNAEQGTVFTVSLPMDARNILAKD